MPAHKQEPTTAAVEWVAAVTQVDLEATSPELFRAPSDEGAAHAWLRSGERLCDLVNAIRPGSVGKVARGAGLKPFPQMENIAQYLDACAQLGVPQHDLFTPVDLWEGHGMKAVVRNLFALGRVLHVVKRPQRAADDFGNLLLEAHHVALQSLLDDLLGGGNVALAHEEEVAIVARQIEDRDVRLRHQRRQVADEPRHLP